MVKSFAPFLPMAEQGLSQLEPLEHQRSEDTPLAPHTIESYRIPIQKKTKSKLQI